MATTRIGAVTRVDYAHGIFVTYERIDATAEGYSDDQRWYYAVWTAENGSTDTGYEVEEGGYARTKAEAKELADICRDSLKHRNV